MLRANMILFACLLLASTLQANRIIGLDSLEGYKTKVFFSNGNEERAKVVTVRMDKVLEFYKKLIRFEPNVTLLILNPTDWPKYTTFPVYGMPH